MAAITDNKVSRNPKLKSVKTDKKTLNQKDIQKPQFAHLDTTFPPLICKNSKTPILSNNKIKKEEEKESKIMSFITSVCFNIKYTENNF